MPTIPGVPSAAETRDRLEALEAKAAELDRSVDTLRVEPRDPDEAGSPGDADASGDLADNARSAAIIEVAQQQLRQVREALRRLDAGEYGRCVDCGVELPADRLDAKPEAARCMTCQGKAELAR